MAVHSFLLLGVAWRRGEGTQLCWLQHSDVRQGSHARWAQPCTRAAPCAALSAHAAEIECGAHDSTPVCARQHTCLRLALAVRRYVKFDTFHPAVERGLPVTRVISRVKLQEILARAATRCAT